MIRLHPFQGYRYDPERSGPLEDLVTQPYDKITSGMLDRYLAKSRFNVAHVIKNSDYAEAGLLFAEWIRSGFLKPDSAPCLYPYEQRFRFENGTVARLGVIGLVPLDDGESAVKGHERITQKAFDDRLELIRRTESNDGLIFSLYSDPQLTAEQALRDVTRTDAPVIDLEDEFGVRHRLWKVEDRGLQERISAPIHGKKLYIADGHHRFHTALAFREECLNQGWKPSAVESFDKRMMALFNMDSPAVKILPTHRALKNLEAFEPTGLINHLERHFEVLPQGDLPTLLSSMRGEGRRLGMVLPAGCYLLVLKSSPSEIIPKLTESGRELDVNLLQDGILEPALGIDRSRVSAGDNLDYFRDAENMIARIREGSCQVGFLLNPTRLDQVRRIADEGSRMPPKSTDFFPKLLTGLVFMKMQIARDLAGLSPQREKQVS